jgi:hypothetical protein
VEEAVLPTCHAVAARDEDAASALPAMFSDTQQLPSCFALQMVVGPGQLQRQSWEGSSKEWRTFHYSVAVR